MSLVGLPEVYHFQQGDSVAYSVVRQVMTDNLKNFARNCARVIKRIRQERIIDILKS
jgi:hypothetical protein